MSPDSDSTALRVLIIDDDAAFRRILEVRLRSFMPQLLVEVFERLDEARAYLEQNPEAAFDLVVLDEHLPDGRGVELLNEGWFEGQAVLSISSDDAPEIPGNLVQAGAAFFLRKVSVSEPLFKPLVLGIIDRNKLQRELQHTKLKAAITESVKTLVNTLRHEINNPLGAVLGAAYLIRTQNQVSTEQKQAAELVESSGKRIKHVLDQLSEAVALTPTTKAHQQLYHIPGDKPWDDKAK